MEFVVEPVVLEPRPTLVLRGHVPLEGVAGFLAEALGTVSAYLRRTGVHAAGPPFARYEWAVGGIDVEAGVPVMTPIDGDGTVVPGSLPGGPAARTLHRGPYDQVPAAYDALRDWVRDTGGAAAGAPWEVYLSDPVADPDPTHWLTEVLLPYAPT